MLRYWLQQLRNNFWFLPILVTGSGVALALVMGWVDRADWSSGLRLWSEPLTLGAQGSREVVSTIAGAMITAASLVYSMTLVALTLAAQSAGQRLLQELMGNRAMQVSLGLFLGTFVYCLLVLRTIVGDNGGAALVGPASAGSASAIAAAAGATAGTAAAGVPNLSVAIAIGLAITSFLWLIYFIHSLASDMQTHAIVAVVAGQLREALLREAADKDEVPPPPLPESGGAPVRSTITGYVETIDVAALVALATKRDARVRMQVRPGHFVCEGDVVAQRWGGNVEARRLDDAIRGALIVGPRRTSAEDPEHLVHLVVEIALRALSPGINDAYTAIACVDHLVGAFHPVLRHGLRAAQRCDERGRVRVQLYPTRLADLIHAACNPLRQACASELPVALRLLEALGRLVERAGEPAARAALRRQAELTAEAAVRHAETDHDRQAVLARLASVAAADQRTPTRDGRPGAQLEGRADFPAS